MKTKYPDPAIGQRFGKLTCLTVRFGKASNGNWLFGMLCDCGNNTSVTKHDLMKRGYSSCGCRRKDGMRKPAGVAAWTKLFDSCKRGAAIRRLEFNLEMRTFMELSSNNCHYCGEPPRLYNPYLKVNGTPSATKKPARASTIDLAWVKINGLDRFDNNKGYTQLNAVPCCTVCNIGKQTMTGEQWLAHCQKVSRFQADRKTELLVYGV